MPRNRCWDLVPDDRKKIATKLFEAIREAGGDIINTNFPCAEDRLSPDGTWDWYDVFCKPSCRLTQANDFRERGKASESQFTVVKVDAYNGITKYLAELSKTNVESIKDIIDFNDRNRGTEGAYPHDHPAFPSGQVSLAAWYTNHLKTSEVW